MTVHRLSVLSARAPDSVALEDGQHALTTAALAARVAIMADTLDAVDAHTVGVLADNGIGWAVADLAIADSGRVAVPLPGFFTDQQLSHAMNDAGVDTVLTDQADALMQRFEGLERLPQETGSGLALLRRSVASPARAMPADTAKITYTSGSTGFPKGVCLSHAALAGVALSVTEATASLKLERHLCVLPLSTLLENIAGLHASLLSGATCVLPSMATTGMSGVDLDCDRLHATLQRRQPDSLILVPQLLLALVTAAERGRWPPASLRFVAVGGARVGQTLLARAAAVGLPVYEGYGLSECASVVTLNTPGHRRPGSTGRVLPKTAVRIADDGEILVSGRVMEGYLGDDTGRPGEIATGDLGYLDEDGFLYVQGRRKHAYATAFGRNVSPEWVESELLQAGAGPALVYGEARPFNIALISATDDAAARAAVERANQRLPEYARVRAFHRLGTPFSFADGTLTANGRLRRDAIHERCRDVIDNLYMDEQLAS